METLRGCILSSFLWLPIVVPTSPGGGRLSGGLGLLTQVLALACMVGVAVHEPCGWGKQPCLGNLMWALVPACILGIGSMSP